MRAPEYHKINSVFMRDMSKSTKPLIVGQYSCPEFEYLSSNDWTWSEKVDGTNIRLTWDGKELHIGGRTDNAQIPVKLIDGIKAIGLEAKLTKVFPGIPDVFLYGEGYGAGIQKGGGDYRDDNGFILFDAQIAGWWLSRENVKDVAGNLGLPSVPELFKGPIQLATEWCKSRCESKLRKSLPEGVVGRPLVELVSRKGGRIITKLKLRDFEEAKK